MKEKKLTKRQMQAIHTKNKIYESTIELMKEQRLSRYYD